MPPRPCVYLIARNISRLVELICSNRAFAFTFIWETPLGRPRRPLNVSPPRTAGGLGLPSRTRGREGTRAAGPGSASGVATPRRR